MITDSTIIIAAIENAIIDRIRLAMDSGYLGYTLKSLKTYGGEFSDGIDSQMRNFPGVLVVFSGASRLTSTTERTRFTARYGILCCAKNLRSEADARHGNEHKVGSYKIAEDLARLLMQQTFGLPIGRMEIQSINPLFNDKSDKQLASIYALEISTTFDLAISDAIELANIGDFETFHANWDVPAHGNVIPPLPADETADATDHVKLEIIDHE